MKIFNTFSVVALACAVAACGGEGDGGGGSGSTPGGGNSSSETPKENYPSGVSSSSYSDANQTQIYDIINKNRTTCGFSSVRQNAQLDVAASMHAKYAQVKGEISHVEYAGEPEFYAVNPSDRAIKAGYAYSSLGEIMGGDYGGTLYESSPPRNGINSIPKAPEGRTKIRSLFSSVYHMQTALADFNDVGIGYSLSNNLTSVPGKTSYFAVSSINFGVAKNSQPTAYAGSDVRSFPCHGLSDVSPIFLSESPNPVPSRDFNTNPMGSPIYIAAPENHLLNIAGYKLVSASDAAEVVVMQLNKGNDPHRLIKGNEVFFVPDLPLRENTEYKFVVNGDDNGKSFQKSFNFTTGLQY